MSPQPTLSVANWFICQAHQEGDRIALLKLVKLVYLAHGWCLGLTDFPLLGEEVHAWKYGPMIPSVYKDFRDWGQSPIEQPKFLLAGDQYRLPIVENGLAVQLLTKIWQTHKHLDGLQLSTICHQEGSPWDVICRQYGGILSNNSDVVIPSALIAQHYRNLAAQSKLQP